MAKLIKPSRYHRLIDGGELLRQRERRGWSQQQLGEYLQISQQFISQLESPGGDGDWHHEITKEFADKAEAIFYK